MKLHLTLILISISVLGNAQTPVISTITPLAAELSESSGLLWLNETLITHNDSGSEPYLHEIDTLTGMISRSVFVEGANAEDWEDLCLDETYLYIGDFGNNDGTRMDLTIYKVSIEDYVSSSNDTVTCELITFSYFDQADFTPAPFVTNYDAEAFISRNDSLYIFTKNWGNGRSNIYSLPKIPGDYSAMRIDSINPEGLVTGADFDPITNELFLTGYTFSFPFLVLIEDVDDFLFSEGILTRNIISVSSSIQIEGIASIQDGTPSVWISSENNETGGATLYKGIYGGFSNVFEDEKDKNHVSFTDNGQITFDYSTDKIIFYDIQGRAIEIKEELTLKNDKTLPIPGSTFLIIAYNDAGEDIERVLYTAP